MSCTKKCKSCEKKFLSPQKRSLFCKPICRQRYKRQGMSYREYKALPKEIVSDFKCLNCEGEIIIKRGFKVRVNLLIRTKKFCSQKCGDNYYKRGNKPIKEALAPIKCSWCEETFTPNNNRGTGKPEHKRRFCSTKCANEYGAKEGQKDRKGNFRPRKYHTKKQWEAAMHGRVCAFRECDKTIPSNAHHSKRFCCSRHSDLEHFALNKERKHEKLKKEWDKVCEVCSEPIPFTREQQIDKRGKNAHVGRKSSKNQKYCSLECQVQSSVMRKRTEPNDNYIRTLLSMQGMGGYKGGYNTNKGISRDFWPQNFVNATKSELMLKRLIYKKQGPQRKRLT